MDHGKHLYTAQLWRYIEDNLDLFQHDDGSECARPKICTVSAEAHVCEIDP